MPRVEMDDHLSDYERAVCYFTLPRIVYRLNPILLLVYFIIVFVSFSVTCWGLILGNQQVLYIGTVSLVFITLFGIIFFTGRALLNELRWRKYLAEAHVAVQQNIVDLPDPFLNHNLYIIPGDVRKEGLFPCVNSEGEIYFFVEEKEKEKKWIIKDPLEKEICYILAKRSWFSITFTSTAPKILDVYKENKHIATIKPKFSFFGSAYVVTLFGNNSEPYWVLQSGIFLHDELVGRIYQVRRNLYLDIKKEHFNLGLLSFFICYQD
ncbi:MAG TPA: hypothetical protein PLT82_04580 [Candidatus Hydrogenedens sp.]|nr:hypothetical protein [Candidatus Hydrogenedens sp.]HOK09524.1 hypothetical protein [Candidatus Hydrogenedens sp.]HOL18798.1 hypothetical protein [Candidatus Hydrogenedens sp.]HPP58387.1 hypothetical protein [Candidatus Hydrogenedens sp.]